MTAQTVGAPTVDPLEEAKRRLREAMDEFARTASFTAGIPAPFIREMRNPEAHVFAVRSYGVWITVSKDAGLMAPEAVHAAWLSIRAQMPPEGTHMHVTRDGEAMERAGVVA